MAETEGNASLKRKKNSDGNFEVYGFGYNGFKQLGGHIFEGDQEPPQNSSYCISKSSLLYPLALNVPRVSSIAASWSSTVFVKGRYAVLFGRLSGKCVPLFIIYHSSFDNKSHACYFSTQETAVSYIHRALQFLYLQPTDFLLGRKFNTTPFKIIVQSSFFHFNKLLQSQPAKRRPISGHHFSRMEGERGGPGIHLCFTGYYSSGALKILDSQGLNREVAVGFFFPFLAELFKARLRKPRVSARFEFRFESLKRISVLIFFICKLMIESSKYNRENYARKCF